MFNIAGTLVPRRSLRPAFSHSTLTTASSARMVWMWSVRQALRPTVRPRSFIASVLHVVASSFRFALGARGILLGADLDGARGILRHAREKVRSLAFAVLSLLVCSRWSVSALQHCMGLCTSAPGCRLDSLSFKKCTARSRHEPKRRVCTEVGFGCRARRRPLGPLGLRASFARLPVAPTRRMQERVRRRRLFLIPPFFPQVQSSPEAAAAEADEESAQVVTGDSAMCWCDSCSAASFFTCPLGCPARFCLTACVATHQASCPLVAFAKPFMIAFHKSPQVASIGWAVAQQGVPVLFNPCPVTKTQSLARRRVPAFL